MKKKALLTSILTIVMCLSLAVGGTFALFTSESNVDIAVTSGKVSLTATIDQNSVATKELYDTEYTNGADNMYEGIATFTNEGLELENFVPGDGIKFNIIVKNESSVTVKYRTVISCPNDNGLFAGLNVNIDDRQNYNGVKYITNWETLLVGSAEKKVEVEIELPESAGNDYQGKSCTISYYVEAVQGNAETINEVYEQEEITVGADNKTTNEVTLGAGSSSSAKVPTGALTDGTSDSFAFSVTKADPNTGTFVFDDGEGKIGLDIKVEGLASNNDVPVTITLKGYVEPGLTGVTVFHKGVPMTDVAKEFVNEDNEFNYDPATGDITLATATFSNFTIVTNSVDFTVPSADISVFDEADLPTKENDMMIFNGAFGGIDFPSIREDVALEKAFKFLAKQSAEEAASSQYADWIADFVIECDQDVALGELGLSGQYQEAFGDTWFTFGNPIALEAGQKLPMISSFSFFFSYLDICDLVKEFNCGIFRGQDAKSMAGKTITVSLCIADANAVEDPYDLSSYSEEDGTLKVLSSISYTFEWDGVIVDNYDDLTAALVNGGNVYLANNIVLNNNEIITIPAGVSATLDLCGNTIIANPNRRFADAEGELNVINGNVILTAPEDSQTGAGVFGAVKGGVLTLKNVVFELDGGMTQALHLQEGTINLEEGTKILVKGSDQYVLISWSDNNVVNFNGAEVVIDSPVESTVVGFGSYFGSLTVNANSGSVIINDGADHYGFAPFDFGTVELNLSSEFVIVAEGNAVGTEKDVTVNK